MECQEDSKLSVLFQYDYYIDGMAHPVVNAFAVNIDISNVKVIVLSDIIQNKKNIVEWLKEGKLKSVVKNNHSIMDDGGYLKEKSNDELLTEMDDSSFYITDNGIGFIFNTTYAVGSYMIYECSNQSVLKADVLASE